MFVMHCPHCGSTRIQPSDTAKNIGSLFGFLGGAISGMAKMLVVPNPSDPPYLQLGKVLCAGLMGGVVGGLTGAQLGSAVDRQILSNLHCQDCGCNFSLTHPPFTASASFARDYHDELDG